MKVVFVCTGNTCRSPMAEAYMVKLAKDREFKVVSAGLNTIDGLPLSKNSAQVLKAENLSFSHHAKNLNLNIIKDADLILTMTIAHKKEIILRHPDYQSKVFTLKEYAYNLNLDDLEKQINNLRKQSTKHGDIENQALKTSVEQLDILYNETSKFDISDPFGSDIDVYENTFREISTSIDCILKKINKETKL